VTIVGGLAERNSVCARGEVRRHLLFMYQRGYVKERRAGRDHGKELLRKTKAILFEKGG